VTRPRDLAWLLCVALTVSACDAGVAPAATTRASTATASTVAATSVAAAGSPTPRTSTPRPSATAQETRTIQPLTVAAQVSATPTLTETIGTLVIPALDREVAIVSVGWHAEDVDGAHVAIWDTVDGAVGHHRGTAPLGGEGNCVLSGHSGAEQGSVLAGIWDLEPDSRLVVADALGNEFAYRVVSVESFQEIGVSLEQRLAHGAVMEPTDDARLTLITCWPDWAYTHRVVVVAIPDVN
jgi:LPXTG-site transpeptidase (sortase) family protein